jgi:hypothetical protein
LPYRSTSETKAFLALWSRTEKVAQRCKDMALLKSARGKEQRLDHNSTAYCV